MSNKFDAKKYLQQEKTTSPWPILPFILTLAMIPFVLGLYFFDSGLTNEYWHSPSSSSTDIFLHYKCLWLSIMGGILAVIFVAYRFVSKRKFSFGIALIPVYVYVGCIILSTIFSTSITHSLNGIEHHFESTFALLTYCMLVLYAAYFVDNEKALRWFINGFLIGTALLALFGIFQYCSRWDESLEPFRSQTMLDYIYMPTGRPSSGLQLNFPLGQVFLTLYNPNYIAYFTTLTAPFFAVLCCFEKKIWKKVIYGLVTAASVFCLAGSQSVAGFLSLGVSAIILIVAFRKLIFKRWIVWVCTLAVFAVAVFGIDIISGHQVINTAKYISAKISDSLKPGYHNEHFAATRNITTSKDGVKFEYNGSTFLFTMDYDQKQGISYTLKDDAGKDIKTETSTDSSGNKTVTVTDKRFCLNGNSRIFVTFSEALPGVIVLPIATFNIDNMRWVFTNQIRTISYSYHNENCAKCGWSTQDSANFPDVCPNCNNSMTPLVVMKQDKNPDIGSYYRYNEYPKSSVKEIFQKLASDPAALEKWFGQLSSLDGVYKNVGSKYKEFAKDILSSDNSTATALEYFNEWYANSDDIYTFFYYTTQSAPIDNNYYLYNQVGRWTQIGDKPASVLLNNYPRLASGRGFIWSRTIPIIFKNFKNIMIGTGPDTFALNYPHYDYVDLYRCDYHRKIITKPHSLYLQIGTQTGFLSLLAVLALYALYLINCIKLYWKSKFTTFTSKVSVAILASISGYMFSGITNDSTVTYSFVFWGLLGVGIAVNRLEKKHIQEEKEAEEKAERIKQQKQERAARKQKANA